MIVDQYKRLKCMQMGYQFAAPRIINDLENMVIEIVSRIELMVILSVFITIVMSFGALLIFLTF